MAVESARRDTTPFRHGFGRATHHDDEFTLEGYAIPPVGFVVNVETLRQDGYQNDGIFNQTNLDYILADCRRHQAAPNAVMLFHAAFIQGITNYSGSAPHAEMGGYGTGSHDRGVRFYHE